jgi:pyruvate dehydrogenase E1 component
VYAAYASATKTVGVPTVILAKTIKGWMLGPGIQGGNTTHQVKKLTTAQIVELRDRLHLENDIPDEALADGALPLFRPPEGSPEVAYLRERRAALDGPLPSRPVPLRTPLPMPDDNAFAEFDVGSGANEVSTTGAFTRLLRSLARDEQFGRYVVPIIPDEGRTFGMDALFKELGIYSSKGQLYEPVDHHLVLSYKEGTDGQILEEGITEAGATASWLAAATSYVTRGVTMVPFYSFYSMFGFQRVGDQLWLAGDAGARGFLLGATAGRTTLQGEGLQHQDGHSLLLASSVPACEAYDPAFAYEMSTIVRHGLRRMYVENDNVFYYVTLYNEGYVQPPKPMGSDAGIVAGLYRWSEAPADYGRHATILFSGSAHTAARRAAADLAEHYGVGAELWSATSFKKLREEALTVERWNRLHPGEERMVPYVTRALQDSPGPFVAVTDYMKAVSDQVARWIPGEFYPLGTDGYGRSDTREALRRFFEVDTGHVVVAVLSALADAGSIGSEVVKDAIARYDVETESLDPRLR